MQDSSVGDAGFSWRWLLVLCQFRIVELPPHSVLLSSFGKVVADYNCG